MVNIPTIESPAIDETEAITEDNYLHLWATTGVLSPLEMPDFAIDSPESSSACGNAVLTSYDKPAPLRCEAISGSVVRIPLKQHVGAAAKAIVAVGQQVRCGELIGQAPADGLGANVHASIDGTVTEASDCIVIVGSEGRRQ